MWNEVKNSEHQRVVSWRKLCVHTIAVELHILKIDPHNMETIGRKTVCTVTFQCHNPDEAIVCLPCQRSRSLSCTYYHNSQWGKPSCHAPWQCLWTSSHFRTKPSRLHTWHQHFPSIRISKLFRISIRRTITEGQLMLPMNYSSAVQRSYVVGLNSLIPMEVRAPPHYYNYYRCYYYYYYFLILLLLIIIIILAAVWGGKNTARENYLILRGRRFL
jgi:hypothetical protein